MNTVTTTVNSRTVTAHVPGRRLLLDFLREDLGLTGTHAGCEHGVCGACTVLFDGVAVRSCLLLAAQADGHTVTTIEGALEAGGAAATLAEAMSAEHGLQCGFCTPGMILAGLDALRRDACPSEEEIRGALAGNVCRCTGYAGIVAAVRTTAERRSSADPGASDRAAGG